MKYEAIRRSAIYTFVVVTLVMTVLGVVAIWMPDLEGVVGRAIATVLVVGLGCLVAAYTASFLETKTEKKEALPSFADNPQVPPPPSHIAKN